MHNHLNVKFADTSLIFVYNSFCSFSLCTKLCTVISEPCFARKGVAQ